jgi:hypothetical protein
LRFRSSIAKGLWSSSPCVGVKTREDAMPLVAPEEPPMPLTALSAACCFLEAVVVLGVDVGDDGDGGKGKS